MGEELSKLVGVVKSIPDSAMVLYEDALQPSLKVVGKALSSSLEFLTIPMKGMQYVSDRVSKNLQYRLTQYEDKLVKVPVAEQGEVHPELGVPILQRLSYVTNDEISELFTNLLVTASDNRTMADAHPSFISMIERLSPDEARIIRYIGDSKSVLYCDAKLICKRKAPEKLEDFDFSVSYTLARHWVTLLPFKVKLDFPDNCELYLANLISMGVLIERAGLSKTEQDEQYKEIVRANNLEALLDTMDKEKFEKLEYDNCFFDVTDLGSRFIKACCRIE